MRPRSRRRSVLGPLAIAALGAIAAIAAPLGATGSSNVKPVLQPGTPGCPAGAPYSLKIDNVIESQLEGVWTSASAKTAAAPAGDDFWTGVTFTISSVSTRAHTFGWAAAKGGRPLEIDSVIVKGGPNANVYTYSPQASSDGGLHAPVNKRDRYYGLSHITFCLKGPEKPAGGGGDEGDRGTACPADKEKNKDKGWKKGKRWKKGDGWDKGDTGGSGDDCTSPPPPPPPHHRHRRHHHRRRHHRHRRSARRRLPTRSRSTTSTSPSSRANGRPPRPA